MINVDDVLHQPQHAQQQPPPSSFKLLALIAAVLLIALIAGTVGYWLGTRNNRAISPLQPTPPVQVEAVSQVTPTITQPPLAVGMKNWKTYTSSYGYSVRYPSDMEHEEPGGYPFDLRIKNEDLTMTFMLQTLRNDKTVEEFANRSACGNRPNDIKIKEEKINNGLYIELKKHWVIINFVYEL